jgi:hypothetical protein
MPIPPIRHRVTGACTLALAAAVAVMPCRRAAGNEAGYHGSTREYVRSLTDADPVSMANGNFSFRLPLLPLGGPAGLDLFLDYRSDRFRFGQGLPSTFWIGPWAYAATDFGLQDGGVGANVCLPDGGQAAFRRNVAGEWELASATVMSFLVYAYRAL